MSSSVINSVSYAGKAGSITVPYDKLDNNKRSQAGLCGWFLRRHALKITLGVVLCVCLITGITAIALSSLAYKNIPHVEVEKPAMWARLNQLYGHDDDSRHVGDGKNASISPSPPVLDCYYNNGGCGNMLCYESFTSINCSCEGYGDHRKTNQLARGKVVTMSSTYCDQHAPHICYPGRSAVNGVYSFAHDMAHTQRETNPWIQIDLGESRCIKAVKVWNRFAVNGDFTGMTVGGTGNGARCVFPFTYEEVTYNGCTDMNHDKPWCATTSNYGQDGKWGECMEVFKNVVVMVSDHANTTLNTEGPDVCKYIQGAPDLVQQFDCSQRMYGIYVSIGMLDTGFLNAYEIEVIGWE